MTVHTQPTRRRRPAGAFTLVEMVMSMVIVSIIMTAMTSLMIIAGKAVPGNKRQTDRVLEASRALQTIMDDLSMATAMPVREERTITVLVPDRTGDGVPEVIRYEWSGTNNSTITRRFNSTTSTLVDEVYDFQILYDQMPVTQTYPGYLVVGSEQVLASYNPNSLADARTYSVESSKWPGQYLKMSLPANAVNWSLTRLQFRARQSSVLDQPLAIQVRTAGAGNTPTSTVLQEVVIAESSLATGYSWREVPLNVKDQSPTTKACLVFKNHTGSGAAGEIHYDDDADERGGSGLVESSNGSSWTYRNDRALPHVVYGTVTTITPDQSITRRYVAAVRLALQVGSDSAARTCTAVLLPNTPESLTHYAELDFSRNPTEVDLDGDGLGDWKTSGSFNKSSLVNGVWKVDTVLESRSTSHLSEITMLNMRCRDTTAGDGGPAFLMHSVGGSKLAVIYGNLARQGNGTQTLTLTHLSSSTWAYQTLATFSGLPGGFVDVELLFDPSMDTVHVVINGTKQGTFKYDTISGSVGSGFLGLFSFGTGAEFDSFSVRVGGTNP